MNKAALVVLFLLTLWLSACGGSGPTEPVTGLAGTVFAPAGEGRFRDHRHCLFSGS